MATTLALLAWGAPGHAEEPPVRIALSSSLVQDIPAPLLQVALRPFQSMMEQQIGMKGRVLIVPATELADQLSNGTVEVGVFQGYEYAWACQKTREFTPLVLAVNQQQHLSARLITARDSPAENLAGLRQRTLAVHRGIRPHCLLYLERECQAGGTPRPRHFTWIDRPTTAEEALDDVVDGAIDSALVDTLAWECYQRRKPGRFNRLKVVGRSPTFPATVMACRTSAFDAATRQRFAAGLQAASQNQQSRLLLQLWKLTGFEPVPRDYCQLLADIAQVYPPPRRADEQESLGSAGTSSSGDEP